MMEDTFARMRPRDPNFVEQFQTTGFDQRTWELGLFAALVERGLLRGFPDPAPDFSCEFEGESFFVEATTANAPMVDGRRVPPPATIEELKARLEEAGPSEPGELVVRVAGALRSKASRRYEDRRPVLGHPFVLAIEPFFDLTPLRNPETPVVTYLFGHDFQVHEDGNDLFVTYETVESHTGATKTIPSGFFLDRNHDGISAVILSNSHTTGKFNRIGYQRGHAIKGHRMYRAGLQFDHTEGFTPLPQEFRYEVGAWREGWAHGLVVIHNPNAARPLNRGAFSGLSQMWEADDWMQAEMADPHIFTSVTQSTMSEPNATGPSHLGI